MAAGGVREGVGGETVSEAVGREGEARDEDEEGVIEEVAVTLAGGVALMRLAANCLKTLIGLVLLGCGAVWEGLCAFWWTFRRSSMALSREGTGIEGEDGEDGGGRTDSFFPEASSNCCNLCSK